MDFVHIDSIIYEGRHGVDPNERRTEQKFRTSVRIGLDARAAAKSDRLSDTINYCETREIIRRIVEGPSHQLLETVAGLIASGILEDPRAQSAEVTIQKTGMWRNGVPGITVTRNRKV